VRGTALDDANMLLEQQQRENTATIAAQTHAQRDAETAQEQSAKLEIELAGVVEEKTRLERDMQSRVSSAQDVEVQLDAAAAQSAALNRRCEYTYIYVYAYIYIYMHMYVYVYHIYIYMHIYVYICKYIHVHVYIYIYICTYTHIYNHRCEELRVAYETACASKSLLEEQVTTLKEEVGQLQEEARNKEADTSSKLQDMIFNAKVCLCIHLCSSVRGCMYLSAQGIHFRKNVPRIIFNNISLGYFFFQAKNISRTLCIVKGCVYIHTHECTGIRTACARVGRNMRGADRARSRPA